VPKVGDDLRSFLSGIFIDSRWDDVFGGRCDTLLDGRHLVIMDDALYDGLPRRDQAINELAASAQRSNDEYLAELARVLRVDSDRVLSDIREHAALLARCGWYPDPHRTIKYAQQILALYTAGAPRKADQMFAQYYAQQLPTIERETLAAFPVRAPLFRAAFWAHRRRKYVLAIPALLAQADGVCADTLNAQLFSRGPDGRPKIARSIESKGQLVGAFLNAIAQPAPLTASRRERLALHEATLNRHAILHGEDLKYGTRINSFKTISLISYLAWLLPKVAAAGATG
jgi:hypothetical protein